MALFVRNRRRLSAPRLYSVVEDPGGRASCEDAPASTPCVELACMRFCETEPILSGEENWLCLFVQNRRRLPGPAPIFSCLRSWWQSLLRGRSRFYAMRRISVDRILRNKTNPSEGGGLALFVQNRQRLSWPRAYIQLSKILVAEPLARMLPLLRRCAESPRMGFCATKPIPGCAIRGDVLISGISLAGGVIAGFRVVFGFALVYVAYGQKIIEETRERPCGRLSWR